MDTNAPCALPWIDTAISRYLASLPLAPPANYTGDQAQFQMCCTDPQNCTSSRPGFPDLSFCALGSLLCTLGTSSYVCRFNPSSPGPIGPAAASPTYDRPPPGTGKSSVCYQEGKLAQPRTNIPCCKNTLPAFLAASSTECLDAYGALSAHSHICCQGASCQFGSLCLRDTHSYACQGGDKTAVCWGTPVDNSSDYCVLETGLGQLGVKHSCLPVQPATSSGGDDSGMCLFKGTGSVTTSPTSPSESGTPPPTKTSSGRALSPKSVYLVALMAAPVLQLLFH
ncbi:hypothetical protein BGZ52_003451 [Haplosporangium bisporale]|nr:hypothetical protein BGZ52_003451 [Haplosporangium bisporale]